MKMTKEDYISEESKNLQSQLEESLERDKELKLAENLIERTPEHRLPYIFEILSRKFATKSGLKVINKVKSEDEETISNGTY